MAANPDHKVTGATRARVESLVSFGIKHEQIAASMDISNDTLQRHYKKQLDTGLTLATEKVANRLFAKAVEQDDFQAQRFFLQSKAGWKPPEAEKNPLAESLVSKLLEKL